MDPLARWYKRLDMLQWRAFVAFLVARFYATHGIEYLNAKFFGVREVLKFGPFVLNRNAPLELHILTSHGDVMLCLWALASWYGIGRRQDRLCIHEDGSFTTEDHEVFHRMFPGCRIVERRQADETAGRILKNLPRTRTLRRIRRTAMKLLDFAFFSGGEDFLLLDSDVLTLGSLEGLDAYLKTGCNVFMTDNQYALAIERSRFEELQCASMYVPANSGLGRVKRGTLDIDRVEFILDKAPEILESLWTEQTLYALLSARFGIALLGPEFNVSRGFGLQGIRLKHYAGITKRLAYVEALPVAASALRCAHSQWAMG
jgi:hypothetical protein